MSFAKKTWVDRISQYPNRRKLIDTNTGAESVVDVEREEGEVSNPGTALSSEIFNDLEQRIFDAFEETNENFSTAAKEIGDAIVALGVDVPDGTDLHNMALIIERQLCKKVVTETQSGTVEIKYNRDDSSKTKEVTFTPPFQGVPTVSVSVTNASGGSVSVVSTSENGFTVRLKAPSGGWTNAGWNTAIVTWNAVFTRE